MPEREIKESICRGRKYIKCRICERERARIYYNNNKEKRNAADRKYFAENKEAILAKRKANPLIRRRYYYNDYSREKQNQYRDELHDSYIKKLIKNDDKNMSTDDIPAELIDLKRSVVQIKRTIKMMTICKEDGLKNK